MLLKRVIFVTFGISVVNKRNANKDAKRPHKYCFPHCVQTIVTIYETRSVLIVEQLALRRYGSTADERPRTGVTFSGLSVVV